MEALEKNAIKEGTVIWRPPDRFQQESNLKRYIDWLKEERNLSFKDYEELWEWSVTDLEGFWESLWFFFNIRASRPYTKILKNTVMPGAEWFSGAELNYAEHVFSNHDIHGPAIVHASELRALSTLSWQELKEQVASFAAALKSMGIEPGDRVVAYMPNIPEAIIAFLATASIGAIWSSSSPDFGSLSVINRFEQVEPTVLIAVDGYRYQGKDYDRLEVVQEIQRAIPTLKRTVIVPYLSGRNYDSLPLQKTLLWHELIQTYSGSELSFTHVPFSHPLWILYSSGTTGLPKAIVQGHGGILLEHLKFETLHLDVKPGDRFFWFTTTGWMMWNVVVSSLLVGATALLYDGSPKFPNLNVLWEFVEKSGTTLFGTSASYIKSCMDAGIQPGRDFDLHSLKTVGSTGSPLSPEGFQWIYDKVKKDLWLVSASGGTDLCSALVGGCPLLPVRAGEIQCRTLGAAVKAFDEAGVVVRDTVGELVVTEPMPSMPLYLWGDSDGTRYLESYFNMFPGVWRHGDWIKVTETGSCVIYGRSDSTINRGGVRIGTSEIYSVVERIPEIVDSLAVDIQQNGRSLILLFVVLRASTVLDEPLLKTIKVRIRRHCSPRHSPDKVISAPDIPRTLNGKKVEVPIKRLLMGEPQERVINKGALANPESIQFFVQLQEKLKG